MAGTKKTEENWAGAVKAIGIRALSSGKFWQFCFLCVLLALMLVRTVRRELAGAGCADTVSCAP